MHVCMHVCLSVYMQVCVGMHEAPINRTSRSSPQNLYKFLTEKIATSGTRAYISVSVLVLVSV